MKSKGYYIASLCSIVLISVALFLVPVGLWLVSLKLAYTPFEPLTQLLSVSCALVCMFFGPYWVYKIIPSELRDTHPSRERTIMAEANFVKIY